MASATSSVSESSVHRETFVPTIEYADLGSSVYLAQVPDSLTGALAELYNQPANLNACVLDDPRHVVLFTRRGRDAVILNQLFDIDAMAARRVCESILRALPNVRRVRINGFKIDPAEIGLPFRTLWTDTDMVMPLPSSVEDYERQLGRSTRKHLRQYMKHLSEALPGFTFEVREKLAVRDDLVRQVIEFNHVRMKVKGKTSGLDESYEQRLRKMLAGYGFAGVLKVQEEAVAGSLCAKVGSSYYLHVQAFDQPYAGFHPGFLCTYLTVCAAIERGGLEYHFLWGNTQSKRQLGARPLTVFNASLYRNRWSRALAASEIWWLAMRRVSAWRAYRRLRHAVDALRRLAR